MERRRKAFLVELVNCLGLEVGIDDAEANERQYLRFGCFNLTNDEFHLISSDLQSNAT